MTSLVYLNGDYTPLSEAKVPVTDRGFLFGDSVYEVIPCYSGHPFRCGQHLERLNESLTALGISQPLDNRQWLTIFERLTDQHKGEDQSLYIQVTRGSSGKRDAAIPKGISPTVFIMTQPLTYPDPETFEKGIAATSHEDIRWHRCNIKATTLLANILMRNDAKDLGAAEAILIRDGHATEGTSSNLFIVTDGTIVTPPKSDQLLPGITRDLVLELAARHQLSFKEAEIPLEQLHTADEIWITSSSREVLAVVALDGQQVGNGIPGPIYRVMRKHYADYKHSLATAEN